MERNDECRRHWIIASIAALQACRHRPAIRGIRSPTGTLAITPVSIINVTRTPAPQTRFRLVARASALSEKDQSDPPWPPPQEALKVESGGRLPTTALP